MEGLLLVLFLLSLAGNIGLWFMFKLAVKEAILAEKRVREVEAKYKKLTKLYAPKE